MLVRVQTMLVLGYRLFAENHQYRVVSGGYCTLFWQPLWDTVAVGIARAKTNDLGRSSTDRQSTN